MTVGAIAPGWTGEASAHAGIGVRCQNVVHIYTTVAGHDVVALRGVNLEIAPGEQVALLGPSGSGKSTLLGLFGGLQRASAGKVIVDGIDISRIPEAELTRTLQSIEASPPAGDSAFQRKQADLVASRLGSPESAALQVVCAPAGVDGARGVG